MASGADTEVGANPEVRPNVNPHRNPSPSQMMPPISWDHRFQGCAIPRYLSRLLQPLPTAMDTATP